MESINRRQFLAGAAACGVAARFIASVLGEDANVPAEIVDTHQHLWDTDKHKPAWLAGAPAVYLQDHGPGDYLKATQGLNVHAVYMEVDLPPAQQAAEADYVIDLARKKSGATRAAVIGGNPAAPRFADYVKRFANVPEVRGVRQVLHSGATPPGYCLNEEFVSGIRLLGKMGLSFDLCMRVTELSDGAKLCDLAPDTRFVIDHCGNADVKAFAPKVVKPSHDPQQWKRDMELLTKKPNTICKISGIVANAPEKWSANDLAPVINHCLDTFGPDRVVFGGDWPICLKRTTLREWINALASIVSTRPEGERQKLWSVNAKKIYKLNA